MLCAALGLALAFAHRRSWPLAFAGLLASMASASFLVFPQSWQDGIFLGLWTSIVLAALSVHLPKGLGTRGAALLSVNCGFWAGSVISAAGSRTDILKAFPLVLLCLPGAWLVSKKGGVAVKVAASWLIAVSILAAALPLTPTPGYKPDHME